MRPQWLFTTALILCSTQAIMARSESEFSLYIGAQEAARSTADIQDVDGRQYNLDIDWNGRSFESPPYFGIRYTDWLNRDWGYAFDFAHSKVYASQDTLDMSGFDVLQFTDGLNAFTLSGVRRFQNPSQFTPYIGLGLGFNAPHVEIVSPLMNRRDFDYQIGGLTATSFAGASYSLGNNLSLFGEVKFDYNQLEVDFGESGNLQTDIYTGALNLGVSLGF